MKFKVMTVGVYEWSLYRPWKIRSDDEMAWTNKEPWKLSNKKMLVQYVKPTTSRRLEFNIHP